MIKTHTKEVIEFICETIPAQQKFIVLNKYFFHLRQTKKRLQKIEADKHKSRNGNRNKPSNRRKKNHLV